MKFMFPRHLVIWSEPEAKFERPSKNSSPWEVVAIAVAGALPVDRLVQVVLLSFPIEVAGVLPVDRLVLVVLLPFFRCHHNLFSKEGTLPSLELSKVEVAS